MNQTPFFIFNALLVDEAIKIFLTIDNNYVYKKMDENEEKMQIEFYRNPYLKMVFYLNSYFSEDGDCLLECEICFGSFSTIIDLNEFYKNQPEIFEAVCEKNAELIVLPEDRDYFDSIDMKREYDEEIVNSLFGKILGLVLINCPEHIQTNPDEVILNLDDDKIIKYLKINNDIQCHLIHDDQVIFKVILNNEIKELFKTEPLSNLFIKQLN